MTQHHEANIARHGGVSLATRALALYATTGLSIGEIAIRLFGDETFRTRAEVNRLLNVARAEAAKAH